MIQIFTISSVKTQIHTKINLTYSAGSIESAEFFFIRVAGEDTSVKLKMYAKFE